MNKTVIKDETYDLVTGNIMKIDSVTNELFLVRKGILKIFTKNFEKNQWILKNKVTIFDENAKDKKNENIKYGDPI
jgi:hypothetical protein